MEENIAKSISTYICFVLGKNLNPTLWQTMARMTKLLKLVHQPLAPILLKHLEQWLQESTSYWHFTTGAHVVTFSPLRLPRINSCWWLSHFTKNNGPSKRLRASCRWLCLKCRVRTRYSKCKLPKRRSMEHHLPYRKMYMHRGQGKCKRKMQR